MLFSWFKLAKIRSRRRERRELIAAMERDELHDPLLAMQLSPDRKLRKLGRSIIR